MHPIHTYNSTSMNHTLKKQNFPIELFEYNESRLCLTLTQAITQAAELLVTRLLCNNRDHTRWRLSHDELRAKQ